MASNNKPKTGARQGPSTKHTREDQSMKTMLEPSIKIGGALGLIHWAEGEQTTPYTAMLHQHVARVKVMRGQALQLIERMRCCAQPNEQFRRQRLVAADAGERSDREKFIDVLKECAQVCFDDKPELLEYVKEVITVEEETEKTHEVFLRQVVLYCVTPLRLFAEETYPAIEKEYEQLEKRRQAYDDFRRRYSKRQDFTASTTSIRQITNPKVAGAKQALQEQADVLEKLFAQTGTHQMTFAKAVATFVLAEMAYREKVHKITNAVRPPEHPIRWKALMQPKKAITKK